MTIFNLMQNDSVILLIIVVAFLFTLLLCHFIAKKKYLPQPVPHSTLAKQHPTSHALVSILSIITGAIGLYLTGNQPIPPGEFRFVLLPFILMGMITMTGICGILNVHYAAKEV